MTRCAQRLPPTPVPEHQLVASRGLDIKTIRFVHQLLEDARDAGKSVLVLSSDLDEILQLADRIVVFAGGRVFGPARRDEIGRDQIGAWIAGHASVAA